MVRKVATIASGLIVLWLAVAFVAGVALGESTGRRVTSRIAESLQANGSYGDTDLALVRGKFELEELRARRDDVVGKLDLKVAEIECDLLPLGFALVDRDCSELAIRGMRLEVSTFALFKLKRPKRKPFHAGAITLEDARLTFSPTALTPSLGKVEIRLHHAEAGPTTFKTPLSFLFALRSLRATLVLPAGIVVELGYANGVLSLAGSVFGARPVALPIELPIADLADDGAAEMKKLVALAKQIAEEAIARRAAEWIHTKTGI